MPFLLANPPPGFWDQLLYQSPTLAIFMGMAYLLFKYMKDQHVMTIKSKDDEIERLVKEKKELQRLLFKDLLLSTEEKTPASTNQQDKKAETVDNPDAKKSPSSPVSKKKG